MSLCGLRLRRPLEQCIDRKKQNGSGMAEHERRVTDIRLRFSSWISFVYSQNGCRRDTEVSEYALRFRLLRYIGTFQLASGT
jgi:hypothetical protein